MALELRLEERKWWVALLIGLAFGAALAGAVHYAWLRGVHDEIRAKRVELDGLNQEIQKGRAAERKLSQFREEVKRLEIDLAKLLQILPSKRNTEDLIKRIEALTRQGDFALKKFTPGEFINKDFYAEWPITIQLDGTYHNLALFFDRVGKFTRIINISGLEVKGKDKPDANSTITATCTATTFVLLDRPAAPPAKPGAPPVPGAPRT